MTNRYKGFPTIRLGTRKNIEDFFNEVFGVCIAAHDHVKYTDGEAISAVESTGRSIVLDLIEEEDKYIVEAELPGLTKDEIKIEITENGLTLYIEREDEGKQKTQNYLVKSRRYLKDKQQLYFKEKIAAENIKSSLLNGVLRLEIGKAEKKGKIFIEL